MDGIADRPGAVESESCVLLCLTVLDVLLDVLDALSHMRLMGELWSGAVTSCHSVLNLAIAGGDSVLFCRQTPWCTRIRVTLIFRFLKNENGSLFYGSFWHKNVP